VSTGSPSTWACAMTWSGLPTILRPRLRFRSHHAHPGAVDAPARLIFAGSGRPRRPPQLRGHALQRTSRPRVGFAVPVAPFTVIRGGSVISYSQSRLLNSFPRINTTATSQPETQHAGVSHRARMPDRLLSHPSSIRLSAQQQRHNHSLQRSGPACDHAELAAGCAARAAGGVVWKRPTSAPMVRISNAAGLRVFNQVDAGYLPLGTLLTADINSRPRAPPDPIPLPRFYRHGPPGASPVPQFYRQLVGRQARRLDLSFLSRPRRRSDSRTAFNTGRVYEFQAPDRPARGHQWC